MPMFIRNMLLCTVVKDIPSLRNKTEMIINIFSEGRSHKLSILSSTKQIDKIVVSSNDWFVSVTKTLQSLWKLIQSFKISATTLEESTSERRYPEKFQKHEAQITNTMYRKWNENQIAFSKWKQNLQFYRENSSY